MTSFRFIYLLLFPLVLSATIGYSQEVRVELERSPNIHIIPYGEHPSQFGQLFIPDNAPAPYPLIILVHGGCWHANFGLELIQKFAKSFLPEGIAVWSIEYRRLGEYGGWPNTYLDVANASDYVNVLAESYPIDLDNVISVGHSSGGHLALWIAARSKIATEFPNSEIAIQDPLELKAAVGLAAIPDLGRAKEQKVCIDAASNMIGGYPINYPERYQVASAEQLLPLGIPQVIIHGDLDRIVPINYVRPYVRKAKDLGDTIRFIQLQNTRHFDMTITGSPQWDKTIDAIKELLKSD